MNRDEMVTYVQGVSKSAGSRLTKLLEKGEELVLKGNKYGVRFTRRQFDLAINPVIQIEYGRSRILELTRKTPMSVQEISAELGIPGKEVLKHISVLRRRNLIVTERVDNRVQKYRGLVEESSRQDGEG